MKICKKCHKEFKSFIIINNIKHILSNRKYCLDCSPFNKHNTQILEKNNSIQKNCPCCKLTKSISEFYQRRGKQGGSVYCKICTTEQTVKRQKILKDKAVQYKGGKCIKCGYNKCNGSLTFHHINPHEKEFSIANCSLTSFDKIKNELDKCILLCYNCHMEIHYMNDIPLTGFEPATY